MSIHEFRQKYGTHTLNLLVGKFIKLSPSFDGDLELAKEIGHVMGDLISALQNLEEKNA